MKSPLAVTTPRNMKQLRNLRYKHLNQRRISRDALYNKHELAYDIPGFIRKITTYPDLVCISGLQEILEQANKVLQLKSPSQRLVILVLKSQFCMQKATGEGWNQCSLFILVLSTLLCVHKTPDEVFDPYWLVSLVLKSLFWMHKTTDEGWNPYRLVILVQITMFCMRKTKDEVWDQ